MIRTLLAALALAIGLSLSATDARADAWLYVRDGIYLNARIGPGTRYRRHHVLSPGTRVQMVGRVGNWAQVRTPDGLLLWVFFSYLIDRPPHYQVRPVPPIVVVPPVRPVRPYRPYPPHSRPWVHPQRHPWIGPVPPYRTYPQPPRPPQVQPRPQPPQVQPRPQPPRAQPKPPRPRQQTPRQPRSNTNQNEILRVTPSGRIIYKGR